MRTLLLAVGVSVAATALSYFPLQATELRPPRVISHPERDCDPCGCLAVAYAYHRELRSTYGLGFDPRNYDATQPHYYFGRIRAYPRYFVEGAAAPADCWG